MGYEELIFEAIEAASAEAPRDLASILAYVDRCDHAVISRAELEGGLAFLLGQGRIHEIGRHRFAPSSGGEAARLSAPIGDEDHRAACEEYLRRFHGEGLEEDDPFTTELAAVRLRLPHARRATREEEKSAEAVAEAVQSWLDRSGRGEVIGFEHGPGVVEILVFGRPDDPNPAELRRALARTLHKTPGLPQGIRVCCRRRRGG
jgi:hypothetical protein